MKTLHKTLESLTDSSHNYALTRRAYLCPFQSRATAPLVVTTQKIYVGELNVQYFRDDQSPL
jgi:ATP-dependent RNA circularization protein (DNA/RNA ligase family)